MNVVDDWYKKKERRQMTGRGLFELFRKEAEEYWYPEMSEEDVAKKVSRIWDEMTDVEKEKWEERVNTTNEIVDDIERLRSIN